MASAGFLAYLADAWKSGWENGAPASLSPSVGRGFFSNWFLSEAQRERAELKALYDTIHTMFGQSRFAEQDALQNAIQDVFTDIFERCSCEPTKDLVYALHDPIKALLYDELYFLPQLDEADWDRVDIEGQVELRNFLLRKRQFFTDFEYQNNLANHTIAIITAGILQNTSVDTMDGTDGNSQELSFQTTLIDLVFDAPKMVESTIVTLFDKDIRTAKLFFPVLEQLDRNLHLASGIDPWRRHKTSKSLILPTDAKNKAPPILVEQYLAHTPFAELFEAPLPVTLPNELRFEHCHILGGTGHGKTQLLQN